MLTEALRLVLVAPLHVVVEPAGCQNDTTPSGHRHFTSVLHHNCTRYAAIFGDEPNQRRFRPHRDTGLDHTCEQPAASA